MHVDGFRFDLAGVLSRDEDGRAARARARDRGHRVRGRARRRASDRGGLGQRRPLPGRLVSRVPLGRVERPLSRHRAPLPARRARSPGRARDAYRGQQRSLRVGRQGAAEQHQLRHLPRRLHAARSRQLRPQAQQRQRRAQPRRPRRELQLELRRSRVRPTIRRFCGCAANVRATSWPCCCSRKACRC